MNRVVCHGLLVPQGSHLFCFAKKVNPKKATTAIRLFPSVLRSRTAPSFAEPQDAAQFDGELD